MPFETQEDRAAEYRRRAEDARRLAREATDDASRKSLLETAETWERMAAYEDEHKLG